MKLVKKYFLKHQLPLKMSCFSKNLPYILYSFFNHKLTEIKWVDAEFVTSCEIKINPNRPQIILYCLILIC